MAGPIITQCPKCETSFRVTEAQLKVANGAVRCGACLHVFNAVQYSLGPAPEPTPPVANEKVATAPATPPPAPEPAEEAGSEQLISDDMETEEKVKAGAEDDEFIQDEPDDVEVDFEIDESFLSLHSDSSKSDPFEEEQDIIDAQNEDTEDWADALLADDEEEIAPKPISAVPPPPKAAPKSKPTAMQAKETAAPKPSKPAAAKPKPEPIRRKSDLPPIEDEPLSLHAPKRSRKGLLLWILLILILAGAFVGQYVFYNFYELSNSPKFRPYLEQLCGLVKCNLPSKIAIHKIKTATTPRVRKHPEREDALIVDILMINEASFQQPFPQIEILFSDQQDKPVASRSFMPAEYLKGELSGITMMPKNKEVHVRFEIMDPGPDAINYKVSFWPLNR